MILDALLKASAAQQVTADAVSGNTIDIGALTIQRRIGEGEPLAALVVITAIGTNTGSAKIQVIQSAADVLSGPNVIGEIDLATADIAAGKAYIIPIGVGIPGLRYLGLNYDITGTVDFTVTAFIGPRALLESHKLAYAKGYTIS